MFVNERPRRIGTGDSGYVSFDNSDPSVEFFKEYFNDSTAKRLICKIYCPKVGREIVNKDIKIQQKESNNATKCHASGKKIHLISIESLII
jgi:hypothetical protein